MPDRREFLGMLSAAPLLRIPALAARSSQPPASAADDAPYDLVITGGRVIDPAQHLSGTADVAVRGGTIAAVGPHLSRHPAHDTIDARGLIVTPGLIDLHVHVYEGVAGVAMSADAGSLAHGVTTVLDAGSAGATTFPGFRRYIVQPARTRIYSALNISTIGLVSLNELNDLEFVDPKAAVHAIEANRDLIRAIKVRLTPNIPGTQDLECLRRARAASDASGVPLLVHIGGSHSSLKDILGLLRRGDMVTHVLREQPNGVVDAAGRINEAFVDARSRGVFMDVGHGSGNFSWPTAEAATRQGWWPDTISTDLHSRNVNGPVVDLPTTLSKFLRLGLTVEQVIEKATVTPAHIYPLAAGCGTLRAGAPADVALLRLEEGSFALTDSHRQTRTGRQRLVPVQTIRAGRRVS